MVNPTRRNVKLTGILALAAVIFIIDIYTVPDDVSVGFLYIIPMIMTFAFDRFREPMIIAFVSATLISVGAFIPMPSDDLLWTVLGNRAIAIGMSGGYAFARFRFPGKSAWFLSLMLSRTVPGIALSLPLFIVYAHLGIIDTHLALIVAYVALNVPFTIWLIDGFFRQVPRDLAEAAQIDGCTRWQAFWQVEFPLAGPGIASSAIFAFLTSWNEFALASQLTRSVSSKTLPVGLLDYTAEFTIDWRGMCALAVVMVAPALALTFVIQKRLVSGLTFGAVKG